MSFYKFSTYRLVLFLTVLLLAVTAGENYAMACCDTKTEEVADCCCSGKEAEPMEEDCETVPVIPADNFDSFTHCPCYSSAPAQLPEAVITSPAVYGLNQYAVIIVEYTEPEKQVVERTPHTNSFHLKFSEKTYRFTEAYLI